MKGKPSRLLLVAQGGDAKMRGRPPAQPLGRARGNSQPPEEAVKDPARRFYRQQMHCSSWDRDNGVTGKTGTKCVDSTA